MGGHRRRAHPGHGERHRHRRRGGASPTPQKRCGNSSRRPTGRGGVIVNILSTAGFRGVSPGLAAYVASKHGARGATSQLALELAPHNIRVLGVAPTYTVTEGNLEAAAAAPRPGASGGIAATTGSVLGRVGVPDDIARVVLFCASDMSHS